MVFNEREMLIIEFIKDMIRLQLLETGRNSSEVYENRFNFTYKFENLFIGAIVPVKSDICAIADAVFTSGDIIIFRDFGNRRSAELQRFVDTPKRGVEKTIYNVLSSSMLLHTDRISLDTPLLRKAKICYLINPDEGMIYQTARTIDAEVYVVINKLPC